MPKSTAETVSAIFNNDGRFFRNNDGRTLSAVAAEHDGKAHKTADLDDTVIIFPDGSAIGCARDGWGIVHLDGDAKAPTYYTGNGEWVFVLT